MGFRQRATSPSTIEYKIGEIFGEFRSGYSLRDALEHVDALRSRSQQEKHELSHLYEAKIRNMGNGGDVSVSLRKASLESCNLHTILGCHAAAYSKCCSLKMARPQFALEFFLCLAPG